MDTKNEGGGGGLLSDLFQSAICTEINKATNKNSTHCPSKARKKTIISKDLSKKYVTQWRQIDNLKFS